MDRQPSSPHSHPDVLRGNVGRLYFLQSLDIGFDVPKFILIDTKLLVLAAADKFFHFLIIGGLVGRPCSDNFFPAGLFFLLVQVNIIRSQEFFTQELVVRHKIRLKVGIHIRLWLHVLQHIPNICPGFIVHGNTLDAIAESIQHKDGVFPVFLRAITGNIPHGCRHT